MARSAGMTAPGPGTHRWRNELPVALQASRRPRGSRCWRWGSSAPVRVAHAGGDLQPQLVVVQRDRLKRPRRAGVQAEREVPPVGGDGDDVDLDADLGA